MRAMFLLIVGEERERGRCSYLERERKGRKRERESWAYLERERKEGRERGGVALTWREKEQDKAARNGATLGEVKG